MLIVVSIWVSLSISPIVHNGFKLTFLGLQNPPCPPNSGTVVFEPLETFSGSTSPRGQVKCLQTHPILQIPSAVCPCPSTKWICVHPKHDEQIVRLRIGRNTEEDDSEHGVILFSGSRREILEGVEVGRMRARFLGGLIRWESMFLK